MKKRLTILLFPILFLAGLSLLLYKKPISRTAMYGLLRQQS